MPLARLFVLPLSPVDAHPTDQPTDTKPRELERLVLGQVDRCHAALQTRPANPLLVLGATLLAWTACSSAPHAAGDAKIFPATNHAGRWRRRQFVVAPACSTTRDLAVAAIPDIAGKRHQTAAAVRSVRDPTSNGEARDTLVALEEVFRAHVLDATGLGALRHDALLVSTVRDAIARAAVGLVTALDHAASSTAVRAAQPASLAALGAVSDCAPAATTM